MRSYRDFGSAEHLHALGAIAAMYNLLEDQLWWLLRDYLCVNETVAAHTFISMSNNTRLDIARRAVKEIETDSDAIAGYLHFLIGYDICAENRNYLMHSTADQNFEDIEIYNFLKRSRRNPLEYVDYPIRVGDLREVADVTQTYWLYGSALRTWFRKSRDAQPQDRDASWPSTLPEKPLLPRKLSLICREALEAGRLLFPPSRS